MIHNNNNTKRQSKKNVITKIGKMSIYVDAADNGKIGKNIPRYTPGDYVLG